MGIGPGAAASRALLRLNAPAKMRGIAMSMLLLNHPIDDDVVLFLCEKRAEGKYYYVYMTAASNKILRRHYGLVRTCLLAQ